MGIYDREYYRDETSGLGWLTGVTPAVKAIIGINIAFFLLQWIVPTLGLSDTLAASSDDIFARGRLWQLWTGAFIHDSQPWHILINMLVLWFFGRDVESLYGTRNFIWLYLAAAGISTLLWAACDYFLLGGGGFMVGASGAVMAIFVIYALYYPRREVLLFFVLPMPIWLLLALFLGFDLLMLIRELQGAAGGQNTAYASHLGGALVGYLFKTYDLRLNRFSGLLKGRPRLKVFNPPRERAKPRLVESSRSQQVSTPSPTLRPTVTPTIPEEGLEQRLDEILAKIAREGREGLSEEEHRVLLEASRRAKLKRNEHR